MIKTAIIVILLFFPIILSAQSMVEPVNSLSNDSDIVLTNSLNNSVQNDTNTNSGKETVTINMEIHLPEISVLPGSLLYPVKTAWEKAKGWFIFNSNKKADYYLTLANKRLAETKIMANKEKNQAVMVAMEKYNGNISQANKFIKKAEKKKQNLQGTYETLGATYNKYQTTVVEINKKIPESYKKEFTGIATQTVKYFQDAATNITFK